MIQALLGFLLAFAESGLGLGAVLPGELAISALAARSDSLVDTALLGCAVALGALVGDHLGYIVGCRGGPRIRESAIIAKLGAARWDRAADIVRRHGFWALIASRLLPLVRTVVPVVAGAANVRYRTFLLASVIGATTWSTMWVGAGAGLAASGALDHVWLNISVAGLVALAVALRPAVRGRRAVRRARAAPRTSSQVEPLGRSPETNPASVGSCRSR